MCEEDDEVCYITRLSPHDEKFPMVLDEELEFVVASYDEICSMAVREKLKKKEGDSIVTHLLPTLEKLDVYMKYMNWETAPLSPENFLYYIRVYHNSYTGALFK